MQDDLFGGTLPVAPQPPRPRDDLDDAIDTLDRGFLYFIIRQVISNSAASLLRKLRDQPEITKHDAREHQKPLAELIQKRLVWYGSRKPLRIGIHRDRVIKAAAETNGREDVWIAGEMGEAAWDL